MIYSDLREEKEESCCSRYRSDIKANEGQGDIERIEVLEERSS